jgi:hypothetical protein
MLSLLARLGVVLYWLSCLLAAGLLNCADRAIQLGKPPQEAQKTGINW